MQYEFKQTLQKKHVHLNITCYWKGKGKRELCVCWGEVVSRRYDDRRDGLLTDPTQKHTQVIHHATDSRLATDP